MIFVYGAVCDDGIITSYRMNRVDRQDQFIDIRECFEQEEIHAGLSEGRSLSAEGFACDGGIELAIGRKLYTQRSDRPGHKRLVFCGGPCNRYSRLIDLNNLVGQAIFSEFDFRGTKGVGFDKIHTGFDVFFVNFSNHIRPSEIELIEADIQKRSAFVEHRSHGSIADDYAPEPTIH
jgi:hypothetical protein